VEIFSIEPEISGVTLATSTAAPEIRENDPGYILRMFADAEGIDDTLFDAGARLLKEVIDV
jgi:hypothetical protein